MSTPDRFGVFNRSQIPPLQFDDIDSTNNAVNGYVPSYDESSGKFTWVSNAGGVSTLADLTDVDFDSGTPAERQVLTYDSTSGKWKAEDALVWREPVEDKDLSTPPYSPNLGDRYLVDGTPSEYGSDILSGGTPSASTTNGGLTADKACDDSEITSWENDMTTSGAQWWKYDLGVGVLRRVRKFRMKCLAGSVIKDFKIQGSNNDSDWTDIYTGQQVDNANWQEYTFTNLTSYRYYRIYITSSYVYDVDVLYLDITETEMIEYNDWYAHGGDIVECSVGGDSPSWVFYTPQEGWFTWIKDENKLYRYDGASWAEFAGGLSNILEDTTPQLGGDLDLNGKNIDFPTVANISDVKDEDDMASDSATMLATQQSIKAYVDTKTKTTFGIVIDGGGGVIETGYKGFIRIPYGATITKVTLLADVSGSIVIDVWKDSYANYPPTDADSITASAPPTLSSATKSEDSTLTGWTTAITAGDCIGFNVDSCTTITKITLIIEITKT